MADKAPDLRATWKVIDAFSNGDRLPESSPVWKHLERIEQTSNRVIIAGGGVVHDMIVDGTYENGVLVLRPRDMPGVEVRRWIQDGALMWQYHTFFTARLERLPD